MSLKILVLGATLPEMISSATALGHERVEVVAAPDLACAADEVHRQHFAGVLLDLDRCGDGAGLQLLLGSERLRGMPVLMLASSPDQAAALAFDAGAAFDWVLKPVSPALLQRRLQPWLDLAARQCELEEQTQDAHRLARLQKQTLGALSHDVRTPLSTLSLNAELVARAAESPALAQAAQRIKTALAMLDLQIDHLVHIAAPGDTGLRPLVRPLDLRSMVQDRLRALSEAAPAIATWALSGEGDAQGRGDATLIEDAIDGLFKLVAAHAGAGAVSVLVDGRSQRLLSLRIQFADALPEPVKQPFFGTTSGPSISNAGPDAHAWSEAEAIVRAHGGSLIGRSRPRDGTLIECLLPRDAD